jgi:hypothetical protein
LTRMFPAIPTSRAVRFDLPIRIIATALSQNHAPESRLRRHVALLALAISFATCARAEVTPTAGCITYSVTSIPQLQVSTQFGYNNTGSADVQTTPGSQDNYFLPGNPNLGQPATLSQGNHPAIFSATYPSGSGGLTWTLSGTSVKAADFPASPLCFSPYFTPGAALSFTAAGTYPSQFLGELHMASAGAAPVAVVPTVAGSSANVTLSNVHFVTSAKQDANGVVPQDIYGDVKIASGSLGTSAVLFDFTLNGASTASGRTTITYAAPPNTSVGCPTDVTASITAKLGTPSQVFGSPLFTQAVTIKNTGSQPIAGPVTLALNGLSENARLFANASVATCKGIFGAPTAFLSQGLNAGASVTVVLNFTNTRLPNATITYTPAVVSGGSKL